MGRIGRGRGETIAARAAQALVKALGAALLVALLVAPLAAAAPPTAAAAGATAQVAHIGAAADTQRLQLVLPLVADDVGLERFATAVSTPGSPSYGHYASIATLARRFGAPAAERRRVIGFLKASGATDVLVNATGMLAQATLSVGLAERLFGTLLSSFRAADGTPFVAPAADHRAASVAVPAALRGLVLGVVGLDTRPVVTHQRVAGAGGAAGGAGTGGLPGGAASAGVQRAPFHAASDYPTATGVPSGCSQGIGSGGFTPNEYLTAHDFNPLITARHSGQGERIAVIEIDGYKLSDIDAFARCFGKDRFALTTYYGLVGHPLPPGTESTLDLEVLDAVTPNLDEVEVFESGADEASLLKAAVAPIITPNAKPQVISESLGQCEAYQDPAGFTASERGFRLAAATGVSYLAASGDHGSANCVDNKGNQADQLGTSYPASSPWVTGVGGTNFTLDANNLISNQVVWNDGADAPGWAGGGGYSTIFKRPSYQNGVVTPNARAVPDVSMLADSPPGYAIYCTAPECTAQGGPSWQQVGGTSAAAPLLAGGVALVDQDLHRKGREFLGFLNPLLYELGKSGSAGSVFHDITSGTNDVGTTIPGGSGKALGCCTATPGYDPASGWGTIDLAHYGQLAAQLLPRIANVSLSIPGRQTPVKARTVSGRLSCSSACTAGAFIVVTIAGAKSFTVDSAIVGFASAGTKSVSFSFSKYQQQRLQTALAHGRRIFAEAFGVVFDPGGEVAKTTAGRTVAIRS